MKVTGKLTGTTDAIPEGRSLQVGFDEDVTRATAVNETHWKQDAIGDPTNVSVSASYKLKLATFRHLSKVAASQNVADVNDPSCQSHLGTSFDG